MAEIRLKTDDQIKTVLENPDDISVSLKDSETFDVSIQEITLDVGVKGADKFGVSLDNYVMSIGGGSGTDDYSVLTNKPKINNVILSGNKTGQDLALVNSEDVISLAEIDRLIYGGLNG